LIRTCDYKAFLVAVVAASIAVGLVVGLTIGSHEDVPLSSLIWGIVGYALFSVIPVAVAGLLVGVPIVLALRFAGLAYLPIITVAGMVSGAAIAWLLMGTPNNALFWPIAGASSGLAAALAWWFLAESKFGVRNA
jgi:hypothetical protein